MFGEMIKYAPTTPTDSTTSGERGQLWMVAVPLLLVVQTSAISHFNQQNEIYPSGYINQPLSASHVILVTQSYRHVTYTEMTISTR